jgi:predicted alpha/beta hydrolase family esterase
MKIKVFIFHGTEGYPEENWFPWMKHELEAKGCEVIVPQFPSPPVVAAKISEWFDVLKPYIDAMDENTIIIGHSLGGVFTLRILEKLENPIRATFLVGAPIGVRPILNYDRDAAFSGFDFNWDVIRRNAKNFEVYQSDDDPYVGLDNGKELAKHLGVALNFIPNAGHFNKTAGYTKFEALKEKVFAVL